MAQPATPNPEEECSYGPCRCPVDAGEPYCSDFCEVADAKKLEEAEPLTGRCGCGHRECT